MKKIKFVLYGFCFLILGLTHLTLNGFFKKTILASKELDLNLISSLISSQGCHVTFQFVSQLNSKSRSQVYQYLNKQLYYSINGESNKFLKPSTEFNQSFFHPIYYLVLKDFSPDEFISENDELNCIGSILAESPKDSMIALKQLVPVYSTAQEATSTHDHSIFALFSNFCSRLEKECAKLIADKIQESLFKNQKEAEKQNDQKPMLNRCASFDLNPFPVPKEPPKANTLLEINFLAKLENYGYQELENLFLKTKSRFWKLTESSNIDLHIQFTLASILKPDTPIKIEKLKAFFQSKELNTELKWQLLYFFDRKTFEEKDRLKKLAFLSPKDISKLESERPILEKKMIMAASISSQPEAQKLASNLILGKKIQTLTSLQIWCLQSFEKLSQHSDYYLFDLLFPKNSSGFDESDHALGLLDSRTNEVIFPLISTFSSKTDDNEIGTARTFFQQSSPFWNIETRTLEKPKIAFIQIKSSNYTTFFSLDLNTYAVQQIEKFNNDSQVTDGECGSSKEFLHIGFTEDQPPRIKIVSNFRSCTYHCPNRSEYYDLILDTQFKRWTTKLAKDDCVNL
ncbi:MAG: hypothetical protein ACXVCP_17285 [Bdellovibrio sp.]